MKLINLKRSIMKKKMIKRVTVPQVILLPLLLTLRRKMINILQIIRNTMIKTKKKTDSTPSNTTTPTVDPKKKDDKHPADHKKHDDKDKKNSTKPE
jgi:hypothetical protein